MQDQAREALKFVLAQFSVSILDTPKSLATLLKQHARAVPQDVQVLMEAVTHGVVQIIRDDPQHDPDSLARVLVMHGAVSKAKAAWAVASWTEVLGQAAAPKAAATPSSTALRTIIVLVGAAATGAMAFLIWRR